MSNIPIVVINKNIWEKIVQSKLFTEPDNVHANRLLLPRQISLLVLIEFKQIDLLLYP